MRPGQHLRIRSPPCLVNYMGDLNFTQSPYFGKLLKRTELFST